MSALELKQVAGVSVAQSSLTVAPASYGELQNCVIRSKDVIEPRRGFPPVAGAFPGGIGGPVALFAWQRYVYALTSGNKIVVSTPTGSAISTLSGSYAAPNPGRQRMKWAGSQRRLYWTTNAGPFRSMTAGSISDAARSGKDRPAVDWVMSSPATLTGGFLPTDSAALYRAWLVVTDANGLEIVGEVSDGVLIQNPPLANVAIGGLVRTGGNLVTVTTTLAHGFKWGDVPTLAPGEANFAAGAKIITSVPSATTFTYAEAGANVASTGASTFAYGASQASLMVRLPPDAQAGDIFRVSRSRSVTPASQTPQPDTFQVYETLLAAGDVAAGFVSLLDNTPDGLLGPICYASPGADGALANNAIPPVVEDICSFRDCLFGANTRERHRFEFQLIATGGSVGVGVGDTLVIVRGTNTITETFGTGYGAGAPTVYTGGTVTSDIERTARSLVATINASASPGGVRARYISSVQDAPGRVLIEATDYSTTPFTVACSSRPLAFQPTLGTTPSTRTSTQAIRGNRLVFSKPGEPDAFPETQELEVGEADDEVLRILPLNQSLVVLKQKSVWLVSGYYPYFAARPLDMECQLAGADTAVVLSDQVHCLTTQGVAIISESGVGLIGLPVRPETEQALGYYSLSAMWGAAYGSEHSYLLALNSTHVYVWNALLKTWSGPLVPAQGANWAGACVQRNVTTTGDTSSDLLWLADSGGTLLRKESKDLFWTDYHDGVVTSLTTSANDGAGLITFTTGVGALLVGDTVEFPTTKTRACVTAVEPNHVANSVTLYPAPASTESGVCTVYRGITCALVSNPVMGPAAAVEKALREVEVHWRSRRVQYAAIQAQSSYDTAFALDGTLGAQSAPPSGSLCELIGTLDSDTKLMAGPLKTRAQVPQGAIRGESHRIIVLIMGAMNRWSIEGLTLIYADGGTERTKRV